MMGDVKGGSSDGRDILGGEYGRKSVAIVEFRGFFVIDDLLDMNSYMRNGEEKTMEWSTIHEERLRKC